MADCLPLLPPVVEETKRSKHLSAGAIAGIVIGGLVLVTFSLWLVKRYQRKQQKMYEKYQVKKQANTEAKLKAQSTSASASGFSSALKQSDRRLQNPFRSATSDTS